MDLLLCLVVGARNRLKVMRAIKKTWAAVRRLMDLRMVLAKPNISGALFL